MGTLGDILLSHVVCSPLLCAKGPEQWQGPGRLFLGEERWAHGVQEAQSPQHEHEPGQHGARVKQWDQQFHLAAQPYVGGLYRWI